MVDLRDLSYDEQKAVLRRRRDADKHDEQEDSSTKSNLKHPRSPTGDYNNLFTPSETANPNKKHASSEMEILGSLVAKPTSSDLEISQSPQAKADNKTENTRALTRNYPYDIHPAYMDERRARKPPPRPSSLPKFGVNADTAPNPFTRKVPLPDWLHEVGISTKVDRSLEIHLCAIRSEIPSAINTRDAEQEKHFDRIRELLHQYEYNKVTAALVKRSRLLETRGLPQLFFERLDGFVFPPDIRADAELLFNKWAREDFDVDIMRGMDWGQVHRHIARHSTWLKPNDPNRVDWKFFGGGDLVSGQWFPKLLACLRDGVHGCSEAGISSFNDKGATSVLLSNPHYKDEDEGAIIHYCGTKSRTKQPTRDTQALHNNIESGEPVRVIRSHQLPKENPYRPVVGFRYDGLYKVESFKVLDPFKAHHIFLLRRLPGQDPIRYKGKTCRPTENDIRAFNAHQAAVGVTPRSE